MATRDEKASEQNANAVGRTRPTGGAALAGGAKRLATWARTTFNHFVFQIDEDQEAAMRSYLAESYGREVKEAQRPVLLIGCARKKCLARACVRCCGQCWGVLVA
jgi:hypothetical protein